LDEKVKVLTHKAAGWEQDCHCRLRIADWNEGWRRSDARQGWLQGVRDTHLGSVVQEYETHPRET